MIRSIIIFSVGNFEMFDGGREKLAALRNFCVHKFCIKISMMTKNGTESTTKYDDRGCKNDA